MLLKDGKVVVHKRKSCGHAWMVYYCTQETVEHFGSKDKVPLYMCSTYSVVKLDVNGCGVKDD